MLEFDDAMAAEADGGAAVEEDEESRKRKLPANAEADGCGVGSAGDGRLLKRIMLSLTKPSYVLGLGGGSLRSENRRRLYRLLRRLARRHDWAEASGVLSVLLKGTRKDRCPEHNRLKYSVLMEVLQHIEAKCIKRIYDIWMARIGSKRNCPSQDRLAVHLELIFFCLTQGNIEKAHQNAQSLMQEQELGRDSTSDLILGLTFYQKWYSSIPRDMQMIDLEQTNACQQTGMLEERFDVSVRNSEGYPAVYSCEASTSSQCNSDTSVMKDKRISVDTNHERPTKVPVKVEDNLEEEQSQRFYMNSSEDEAPQSTDVGNVRCASFLSDLVGLDSWLLPIRLPQNIKNSEDFIQRHREKLNVYKDAVKYLRLALDSSRAVSDALLPLIQLLLICGQVDEALNVLEEVCHHADTALPLRVRAALLERFARENVVELSSCYEEILKRDPTCCHSMARLVTMHQSGDYHPGSMLEMISLHLDAMYAEHQIWREFAMCFLKLARQEEDCMSVHLDGKEGGFRQNYSGRFNRIPDHFLRGGLGKNWRFRCRWWLTRHFSYSILETEIAAGYIQLLTCKAACAAHMYGQEFEYVVKVYNSLEERTNEDFLLFLRTHLRNSVSLQSSFQQNRHNFSRCCSLAGEFSSAFNVPVAEKGRFLRYHRRLLSCILARISSCNSCRKIHQEIGSSRSALSKTCVREK
ncbi:uncharacterized protein LOC115663958 [Syzygium oleosum]|uniref:uncharacterized protein LOC115663958 n=1 Tax=Syzygium oleosum TaxID=219896 RepID=UPI0024BB4CF5|nr:uncharacterized protein LOC115663958 [Syzygium oleosum]